jgi:superfamily I DNA/RNA helicase/mRNA-degrading endonuclease RelE of RelBE toxin-antitoxin system
MTQVSVAKSFFKSCQTLKTDDRSRVFDFMAKLYENPAHPGLNLEGIKTAIDKNMRSARISKSLRAIVHVMGTLYTLLYAGNHDEAYDWAGKHSLKHHPVTGVLQIVESVESVKKVIVEDTEADPSPTTFQAYDDSYLLSLGVPEDWLSVIRHVKSDDQVLTVAEKLPEEVAERLICLASGELVTPPEPVSSESPVESSSDNLRRFWVVKEAAELIELLEKPIEDWMRFIHPSQSNLAKGTFKGPVKVTGSAGTGKTVVAMHRAKHLAQQGKRVLLTSFVTTLCKNIERNLQILCTEKERSLITVATVHSQALSLTREVDSKVYPVDDKKISELIAKFNNLLGSQFDPDFLSVEWHSVVQSRGIKSWGEYRDAQRTGRGKPLSVKDRRAIWDVFERVQEELEDSGGLPWSWICRRARELVDSKKVTSSYQAVLVDELQDLSAEDLKFLACLCTDEPGNLMLVGDAGQRIYAGGFSLSGLGIEVRGRSHILKINYRTTEQIRRFADRLLEANNDDMDGGTEDRSGTHSLLRGPEPRLVGFATTEEEYRFVYDEIKALVGQGLKPRAIAAFARMGKLLNPLKEMLAEGGIPFHSLSNNDDLEAADGINLGTMHRAKGLEFKVVFALSCSEGTLPLAHVLKKHADPVDRSEALERERQLLYVSVTRARDEAYVTWAGKPSQFVEGLVIEEKKSK